MSALPVTYDLDHRRAVQKALNEKTKITPALVVDGNFGNLSVHALSVYQAQNDLTPSATYDAATQALLEPFIASKYLLHPAYIAAGAALDVEVAAVQAVCETESQGAGFFSNGQCEILFERHWMYQNLVKAKTLAVTQGLMKRFPTIINPTPGGYLGGIAEYTRLNLALTVDRSSALLSTSWGLFQIMGFNFTYCGYAGVENYVADMQLSETKQLNAFVGFIKTYSNGALWTALKNQDWTTFAKVYNGPANVAVYSTKMANNYKMFATTTA